MVQNTDLILPLARGPVFPFRYDFTDGDLSVSLAQLHEYLDTYETPPYK
jgi:hypothetical protein